MKREDFKEIKKVHINFCESVITNNGRCHYNCDLCPFCSTNLIKLNSCTAEYAESGNVGSKENIKLVRSCEEFIDLFKCDFNEQCYHYATNSTEPLDLIIPNSYSFARGNIIKYAHRIGKKHDDVKDICKIIDYAIILGYENNVQLNEEDIINIIKYRFKWIVARKK